MFNLLSRTFVIGVGVAEGAPFYPCDGPMKVVIHLSSAVLYFIVQLTAILKQFTVFIKTFPSHVICIFFLFLSLSLFRFCHYQRIKVVLYIQYVGLHSFTTFHTLAEQAYFFSYFLSFTIFTSSSPHPHLSCLFDPPTHLVRAHCFVYGLFCYQSVFSTGCLRTNVTTLHTCVSVLWTKPSSHLSTPTAMASDKLQGRDN